VDHSHSTTLTHLKLQILTQNYSLDYVYDWTVKQEQGSTPARNPGGALPHNGRERERDEANTREASPPPKRW